MKRHILDHPKSRTSSGMKLSFSRIQMKSMPHRETLVLQRRPRDRDDLHRMREFLRIERGELA